MNHFHIRSYSKKELALCYFPTSENSHAAVNHLMTWIKRCKPLITNLEEQGYQRTAKWFTPREVMMIVHHLGEP